MGVERAASAMFSPPSQPSPVKGEGVVRDTVRLKDRDRTVVLRDAPANAFVEVRARRAVSIGDDKVLPDRLRAERVLLPVTLNACLKKDTDHDTR